MPVDLRRHYRIWLLSAAVVLSALAGRWMTRLSKEPIPTASEWPDPAEIDSLTVYAQPVGDPPARAAGFGSDRPGFDPFASGAPEPAAAPQQQTAVARPAPAAPLIVTAILITDARRVAVINDTLFTLGDRLPGGGRLSAIERDHVVVQEPGGTRRSLPVEAGGKS